MPIPQTTLDVIAADPVLRALVESSGSARVALGDMARNLKAYDHVPLTLVRWSRMVDAWRQRAGQPAFDRVETSHRDDSFMSPAELTVDRGEVQEPALTPPVADPDGQAKLEAVRRRAYRLESILIEARIHALEIVRQLNALKNGAPARRLERASTEARKTLDTLSQAFDQAPAVPADPPTFTRDVSTTPLDDMAENLVRELHGMRDDSRLASLVHALAIVVEDTRQRCQMSPRCALLYAAELLEETGELGSQTGSTILRQLADDSEA